MNYTEIMHESYKDIHYNFNKIIEFEMGLEYNSNIFSDIRSEFYYELKPEVHDIL